jgi:hypothetical protein
MTVQDRLAGLNGAKLDGAVSGPRIEWVTPKLTRVVEGEPHGLATPRD